MEGHPRCQGAVFGAFLGGEFAGKLRSIEHLNLTPDLLTSLLGDLMQAGTQALESKAKA